MKTLRAVRRFRLGDAPSTESHCLRVSRRDDPDAGKRSAWFAAFYGAPGGGDLVYKSPSSFPVDHHYPISALHLEAALTTTSSQTPHTMTSQSSSQQRSLFCQCNKTPCVCWPSTSPRTRTRSHSRSQPLVQSPLTAATTRPHYVPAQAQQLPSPHTPSYKSPTAGSYYSPNPAASPSLTVPTHSQVANSPTAARSPQMNTPQLHPLLKAQSILRTPESPSALRLRWDVRDSPATAVVHSQHEPEYLYEHPNSVAYATNPPVPFLLVACNDALPWLAPVHAREGSAGVTVRDVLEAISEVTHTQVEESMAQLLPTDEDRARLYQAYHNRVKRNGSADKKGILAVDWLGEKTLFVCLERDEALARKRVKEEHMWPYVFSLKLKMRKGALVSDA